MHLRVAVHASLSKQELRWCTGCQAVGILRDTWVARLRVAALAEQRCALREHARVIRAMRRVAQSTVFTDRCMLPEIRTALLSMTLLTGIVDSQARELCRDGITVHVMAAHAVHFSLQDWMCKSLACFAALYLMAGEADIRLRRCLPDGVYRRVTSVAVGTGHFVARVSIGMPAETDVALMAGQACAILCFESGAGVRAVYDGNRRPLLSSAHASGMRVAWTMAGLALQLAVAKGSARVRRYGVLGAKYRKRHVVIVAGQAGVCTLAAVL